jgi:hypothetical protein
MPLAAMFTTRFCGRMDAIERSCIRTEEVTMGIVMIKCPATSRAVSTGIEMLAVDALPIVVAKMSCSACGSVHEWTKNDAWLADGNEDHRPGQQHRPGSHG